MSEAPYENKSNGTEEEGIHLDPFACKPPGTKHGGSHL
jgi:hypothetical protein